MTRQELVELYGEDVVTSAEKFASSAEVADLLERVQDALRWLAAGLRDWTETVGAAFRKATEKLAGGWVTGETQLWVCVAVGRMPYRCIALSKKGGRIGKKQFARARKEYAKWKRENRWAP